MADNLVAIRIGPAQWLTDSAWERTLGFVGLRPGTFDEIALFTQDTHAPLPLQEFERRAVRLGEIIPQGRALGYVVGINCTVTVGHHEENLPNSLPGSWRRATDHTGRVSLGAFCPGSADMKDYADRIYDLVARAGPRFIWVDDDVRFSDHKPIAISCFCDDCVARFNAATKAAFDRPSLARALAAPPSPERDALREQWLEHNRRTIAGLLQTIERAVHRVDPTIQLGFMTGDRFCEGYAFAEWAAALEGPRSGPARWRPGQLFYSDDSYLGLVEKAHEIGRQTSQLPASVAIVQSEVENIPYQRLRKSVAVTALEAAAYMGAGCTGTAFNIIFQHREALDEYEPFVHRIAEARPFYAALRDALGRGPAAGVWPAWNRSIFANRGVDAEWLPSGASLWNRNLEVFRQPYVLGEIGLPIAYGRECARVTALSGSIPASFERSELESIFRGGVLLDGEALLTLERMGLSDWAGATAYRGRTGTVEHDAIEQLSDHPLNGRFAGWHRDCRQSFWPQPAYRLETAPGAQVLARIVDYGGKDLGPTMVAYENSLGGRVVVLGYYPWTLVHSLAKSTQMKTVCDWCSRGTLPAIVETFAKVVVWAREGAGGRLCLVVLNASLDPLSELVLRVRTTASEAEHVGMDGERAVIATKPDGGGGVRARLQNVGAWSMRLLQFQSGGRER